MKFTLVILFLLINALSFGQSFGEIGTVWKNYWSNPVPSGVPGVGYIHLTDRCRYEYKSDTIIGLDTVQFFHRCGRKTGSNGVEYYEDTIYVMYDSSRVYTKNTSGDLTLHYDFNLVVGDTFPVVTGIYYPADTIYLEVVHTDSVIYNGTQRKTIEFEDIDSTFEPGMVWVEGVGDTVHGLFTSILITNPSYDMECFIENGISWIGGCDSNFSCDDLKIQDIPQTDSLVLLPDSLNVLAYPNPFTEEITLLFKEADTIYEARVFDIHGNLVYETLLTGSMKTIDLSFLSVGVYTVNISDGIRSYSIKIVKQ